MCKNVIFLDIDGVLNNQETFYMYKCKLKPSYISEYCLSLLLDSLNKIDNIKVVISSTWRKGHSRNTFINHIKEHIDDHLFEKFVSYLHTDWATPIINKLSVKRGDEVHKWLCDHQEVNKFLCIDDNCDFYKNQPLLKTSTYTGLTYFDKFIIEKFFIGIDEKTNDDIISLLKYETKTINRKINFVETI